ncbi:MAG: hypothetical protein O2807_00020 [bacterium]|nr:hypothetical protein [bacterium]
MTGPDRKKRNDLFVWVFLGTLTAIAGISLWWAQPVLFRAAGVRAELMEKAKVLRGLPPREAVSGVGRLVKIYLDAARHVSGAKTQVTLATQRKLEFSITLPWSEKSEKKWKLRGQSAARLTAGLLRQAGTKGVNVRIEIRRREISGARSEPGGWYGYEAAAERYLWVPKE